MRALAIAGFGTIAATVALDSSHLREHTIYRRTTPKERTHADDPRPRPGHDQLARHRVRRDGPQALAVPDPAASDLPYRRLGGAGSGADVEQPARVRPAGHRAGGRRATPTSPRSASRTSARPCRLGPRHRRAAHERDRVAGPPHRRGVRRARAHGRRRHGSREDRAAHRPVLLGEQDRVDPRQRRGCAGAGRGRRARVRDGRLLVRLEAHRRRGPRDRLVKRLTHAAVQHRPRRVGRRAARPLRRASLPSARGREVVGSRGLDGARRLRSGDPGRVDRRRPAGGARRQRLLLGRRREGHLRNRASSRSCTRARPDRTRRRLPRPSPLRSATRSSTRSRAPSSWVAPSCSGSSRASSSPTPPPPPRRSPKPSTTATASSSCPRSPASAHPSGTRLRAAPSSGSRAERPTPTSRARRWSRSRCRSATSWSRWRPTPGDRWRRCAPMAA